MGALGAAGSLLLQGCYESLPVQHGAPPATTRVEFLLNDQGRAALSQKLGPAVQKIEGELVDAKDSLYMVSVFRVTGFDGNSAAWTGERVALGKDHVDGYQVRRLNKTRSALVAVGVVAAVVSFFVGRSLLGGGSEQKPPGPDPQPSSSSR